MLMSCKTRKCLKTIQDDMGEETDISPETKVIITIRTNDLHVVLMP